MTPRARSSKAHRAARSKTAARYRPRARVLVVVAFALLAGCASSAPSTATPEATASTDPAVTSPHEAATGTLPEGTATIDKAELPVGTVLVDGTGFVLYALVTDAGGASPCVDACAKAWPPLTGTGIAVAEGVPVTSGKFTLVKRPDGTSQVAVNGHPLYRYSGDSQQGQASGQGIGGVWFVVDLEGNPIKS